MHPTQNDIHLSTRELMYLKNVDFLPESLARIVEAVRHGGGDKHVLTIQRDTAERFRTAFTNRLATAGFDADYEPTSEGKMLEDLIDRFRLV
jgi:hypothetical protein